jgi:phosphate-selective porin
VLCALGVAPSTLDAQTLDDSPAEAGAFRWAGGPSWRLGDAVRLDLHARVQSDVRLDEKGNSSDEFAWGGRRVGIEGALFKRLEFQIERELVEADPWRDVFADLRLHRSIRVRAGQFKVPFSMERTTGAFDLDFVKRSTAVSDLAPGREPGVMVHGRIAKRLIEYETGIFTQPDDPVTPLRGAQSEPAMLTAGRVVVAPMHNEDGLTRDLRVGVAATDSRLPKGLHESAEHFDVSDVAGEVFYVGGRRTRLGLEGLWNAGRLSVKGELIRQTDSRKGAAVTGADLPDLVVHGGYLSGTWRLLGTPDKKRRALDLAGRFDRLALGGGDDSVAPSTSPRAARIAPLVRDSWTLGANWLVNRWVKLQVNAVRQRHVDPMKVRISVPGPSWSAVTRIQLAI